MKRRILLSPLSLAVIVVFVFGFGFVVSSTFQDANQPTGILDEAVEVIAETSAVEIDRDALRRAAIDGMLKSLGDRWSQYFPKENTESFRASVDGKFSGIGVWLRNNELGHAEVVAIVPGSSAENAGVLIGDTIVSVDGRSVKNLDLSEISRLLTGEKNSTAKLSVNTQGELRELSALRQDVSIKPVVISTLNDGVTVIKVSDFARGTARDIRSALASQIGERAGVILDLRGNTGGLVTEAIEVAGTFLNGGAVVEFHRPNTAPQVLKASAQGDGTTPLVILVDAATASSAEIVAAALQDRSRAVIVGENTFGKAAVQDSKTLSDGSLIELTVGFYVTPNGKRIDGVGVAPDIYVSAQDENITAESRALQVLDGLVAAAATRG
ncbi:MAG: S41 family peptidase [Candidatus Nanopelagicales bacterium]